MFGETSGCCGLLSLSVGESLRYFSRYYNCIVSNVWFRITVHREHYDFSREVKLISFNYQGWKREDKEERVEGRNDDE